MSNRDHRPFHVGSFRKLEKLGKWLDARPFDAYDTMILDRLSNRMIGLDYRGEKAGLIIVHDENLFDDVEAMVRYRFRSLPNSDRYIGAKNEVVADA